MIRNVHKVEIHGWGATRGSTLISDGGAGTNVLMVTINVTVFTDEFDIYCNASDTCYINCLSGESCSNVNLYCDGPCFVNGSEPNGKY